MTASFFESKKAAAILKHAILDQYVDPFAMKAGLRSPGGRVAFVDGYAGEGRYDDGGEGSPALLLNKARKLAPKRQIECMFVEEDENRLAKLNSLIEAEGSGLVVETYLGDIKDHLNALIDRNRGIPIFVFLDPFGLMVPFSVVTKIFSRPGGVGSAATEVLINFNATGLRRIAGHLRSKRPSEATLRRMDQVCGGTWWRDAWLSNLHDKEAAEQAVIQGYAERLSKGTQPQCSYWTVDVRNKSRHLPSYYLIFLTRHRDGMLVFGESVSLGLAKWRDVVNRADWAESLFDDDEFFQEGEDALSEQWVREIKGNLRKLLEEGRPFVIGNRYPEVYGTTLGKARQTHLRKAWKELYSEKATKTDSKGDLLKKKIEPA